jgi:hypothetical protein
LRKKTTGWAVRVGWTGREAEAQWEREKWLVEKKRKWAKSDGKILFRIKFDF